MPDIRTIPDKDEAINRVDFLFFRNGAVSFGKAVQKKLDKV
jgi:hypothetical protein